MALSAFNTTLSYNHRPLTLGPSSIIRNDSISICDLAAQLAADNAAKQSNIGFIIGESLYNTYEWLHEKVNPQGLSIRYLSWRLLPNGFNSGYTALHQAIVNEDMTAIHYFMPLVDMNSQSASGETAIHLTTRQNFLPGIQVLIQKGANLNLLDKNGFSPLAVAMQANNRESFKALLAAGADLHQPCPGWANTTPLQQIVAYQFSFRDMAVEHILAHTTPLTVNHLYEARDFADIPKLTPLMLAAVHPSKQRMIADLIEKGADINFRYVHNNEEITVTSYILKGGLSDALQAILKHNPDIESPYKKNGKDTTLLVEGLNDSRSREVMARHYLSKVTPSIVNQSIQLGEGKSITPIMLAIELGKSEIVEPLLAKGADVETLHEEAGFMTTPLQKALNNQALRPTIAKHILKQTTAESVNRFMIYNHHQATTPLMLALELEDEASVEQLLKRGADPNLPVFLKDGTKITPYQWAQKNAPHLPSFHKLQKVALTLSPLQKAIKEKNITAIKRHSKNVKLNNRFDENGLSPLALAIQEEVLDAIPLLVESIAHHEHRALTIMSSVSFALANNQCHLLPRLIGNIDGEIIFGENLYQTKATPLMLAIQHENIEAIRTLLSKGANTHYEGFINGKKTTPLEMMLFSNNETINDIIFNELENSFPSNKHDFVGPKQKNAYTTLFEDLIRQILKSPHSIKSIRREDSNGRAFFNLIVKGQEYAMDNIVQRMDWEQLRLQDEDYQLLRELYLSSDLFRDLLWHAHGNPDPSLISDKYQSLNKIDASIIKHYTTGFSYKINGFLKGGDEKEGPNETTAADWWIFTAFFTNALNKIEPETTRRKFCRGQSFDETILREREITFISTSPDGETCEQYAKGKAVLWLSNAYGKEITALSDHPSVREYVIPPNTLRTHRLMDERCLRGEPNAIPEYPRLDESLVKKSKY